MAAAPTTRKIEIELPDYAKANDRLAFTLPIGAGGQWTNFSAVVPENALPGRKIGITVPVPAGVQAAATLSVSKLTINGQPVLPRGVEARERVVLQQVHDQVHGSRHDRLVRRAQQRAETLPRRRPGRREPLRAVRDGPGDEI